MSGRTKQPSFGGVAALFGEDDEDTGATAKKKKQPSFGGVAGLFGTEDDDDNMKVSAENPMQKKTKNAPSFGGVAAMFGEDTEKPPTQIVTKPKKPAGRQASFGGVAALFGEEEEETPSRPNRGKQASFGGVASLFGSSDDKDAAAPVKDTQQNSNSKGARQQSFGGVASLFGSGDAEDKAAPQESKSITGLFGNKPQPKPQGKKIAADTVGSLPQTGKSNRKKKRDPSVSGIASLFGDDDDDEQPDLKSESKDSGVKEAEIHKDLRNQTENLKQRAQQIRMKIEREQTRKEDLTAQIKQLEASRTALAKSKQLLAQMTAVEMERMRTIFLASSAATGQSAKVATIS